MKSLTLMALLAFSQSSIAAPTLLLPRIIGEVSENGSLFGNADVMVPLSIQQNGFIYGDLNGSSGGYKGWMASMGAGYRHKYQESWVAGIYAFADRNYSQYGNIFWVINPGVELFNGIWDFHANGYLPNNRSKAIGTTYGQTTFLGHTQYNNIMQIYDANGRGADVIVGRTFSTLSNTRIYGAGYYYSYEHTSPMPGIEIGLESPLGHNASLIVSNSYDNVNRDQISIGLKFTWGDTPTRDKKSINDHMLDAIDRHMGSLDTGAGNPSQKVYKATDTTVTRTNIWFFNPNSSNAFDSALGTQNCTFEHPCAGTSFTQGTINSINTLAPNPNLYVNTGTVDFTGTLIELPTGTGLYGRQNNFKNAGSGNNRPLFNGIFQLDGSNNLNDSRIEGGDISVSGLSTGARSIFSKSTATGTISISGVTATATSNTGSAYAAEFNGGDISITDSTLTSNVTGGSDKFAIGIQNGSSTGTITMNNSTINASNTSASGGFSQGAVFIGTSVIHITDGTINATNLNGTTTVTVLSTTGIKISDTVNLTIDNSTITTDQRGGTRNSAGINSNNSSIATINNSTLNVLATQPGHSAYGTYESSTSSITFNNSTLNITNTGGTAALDGNNPSTLNSTTATCNGVAC